MKRKYATYLAKAILILLGSLFSFINFSYSQCEQVQGGFTARTYTGCIGDTLKFELDKELKKQLIKDKRAIEKIKREIDDAREEIKRLRAIKLDKKGRRNKKNIDRKSNNEQKKRERKIKKNKRKK